MAMNHVPILKLGDALVVTIQAALTDAEMDQARRDIAESVAKHRVRGLLVDVSALDVLDSFASRTLVTMARVVSLRGARTVIVGIQPDVAFAMVQLGLTMEGLETSLDLEGGLDMLGLHVVSTPEPEGT
jgi:rsbT antagonist protein RsbS